ncbi:non-homologous end joining protein Ku, partial [Streptomyces anulatus]|uniref:non-homologous end joining protein Ku n=1 Tax=Streptomyces anulatus TaxID=1892 RepID=UPI00367F2C2D
QVLFDKSYYLEPDSATPKAYQLLAATLERIDKTALVHFTLRQKTRLAALRVRDGVLVLQTLLWPDEVRAVEFPSLDEVPAPRPQELKMAETLVESMSGDFDPSEYTDEYQIELQKLLDEAIASGTGKVEPAAETEPAEQADAEVVDLVAALQRSLEASGRREAAPAKPAKKAAKKAAPRKAATSKSTASKTATRKGA